MTTSNMDGSREGAEVQNVNSQSLRERLAKVTAADVDECADLYFRLERARQGLGLKKWASLQGYFGPIPRCVKAVGGKIVEGKGR
jgi:hypothetical protein